MLINLIVHLLYGMRATLNNKKKKLDQLIVITKLTSKVNNISKVFFFLDQLTSTTNKCMNVHKCASRVDRKLN